MPSKVTDTAIKADKPRARSLYVNRQRLFGKLITSLLGRPFASWVVFCPACRVALRLFAGLDVRLDQSGTSIKS